MIIDFYNIAENIIRVKEGDVMDFGHNKTTFTMIPMVH